MDADYENALIEKFKLYDKNHSNAIEIGELKKLLKDTALEVGMSLPSDDDIQKTLKDYDENGDKRLCLEEFRRLFDVLYQMQVSNN
jgi:Ca2+-binding EF-hand superfamily protein